MTARRQALTGERLRTVQELFGRAIELEPDERARLLAATCGTDDGLREEVESLIKAHAGANPGWDRSAAEHLADALRAMPADAWAAEPLAEGTRLGAYTVVRRIGAGGMGEVYEGVRADEAYSGRVAIKTLGRGLSTPALVRRFIRERQILARLQHPNIAVLHDGGATESGLPWLVMEYVEGQPLDRHCDARRLTIHQRLDLFRQVCAAIQYAHSALVIHRDLKPANILVTDDGTVKLLDFGIAKLMAADGDSDGGETRDGYAPLTSAYASPEQARGESITTASDVYSAGVVLYRLLAGAAPYDVAGKSLAEVRTIISEQVPPPPSAVATREHAEACGLSGRAELQRALSRGLDAIVMMALRKEPGRRYASAEALSQDLLRYLRGLPVAARPNTLGYRVATFVRRRRAVVVGTALVSASLIGGTIVALHQASVARAEAARTARVTQYLQAIVGAADPSHYSALRTGRLDVGLLEVLDSALSRVGHDLASEPRVRADLYWSMGNAYRAFGRLDLALALEDSARDLHAASVGPRSIDVARDIHFAGITLQEMGRFADAAGRFRDASTRYHQLRAVPDTELTDIETSLGQVLGVGLTQFDEGERLLRNAAMRESRRPIPRISMSGIIQGALGTTLMRDGDYAAADSAFERSVAWFDRDSLRARGERAYALMNWGLLKSRQGRFDEAAAIKRRAVTDLSAVFGTRHVSVVRFQVRLAEDLLLTGRTDEARALSDSAAVTLSEVGGGFAAEWSSVFRLRGAVARAEGRLGDAQRALDRAGTYVAKLEGAARVGPEVELLTEVAQLAEAQGRLAHADSALRRSHDIAAAALGDDNPVTLAAIGKRAALARRGGDISLADSLLADSARWAGARKGRG